MFSKAIGNSLAIYQERTVNLGETRLLVKGVFSVPGVQIKDFVYPRLYFGGPGNVTSFV